MPQLAYLAVGALAAWAPALYFGRRLAVKRIVDFLSSDHIQNFDEARQDCACALMRSLPTRLHPGTKDLVRVAASAHTAAENNGTYSRAHLRLFQHRWRGFVTTTAPNASEIRTIGAIVMLRVHAPFYSIAALLEGRLSIGFCDDGQQTLRRLVTRYAVDSLAQRNCSH